MSVSNFLHKALLSVTLSVALLPGASTTVMAQEEHPYAKDFDVKANFRNICGFCHQSYGRQEGKGPQLMNSTKTAFSDDKIWAIVKFIRSLKPDVEPENPS